MDDNHDGAGDLLTKPDADKKDVHVLSLAWQSWVHQTEAGTLCRNWQLCRAKLWSTSRGTHLRWWICTKQNQQHESTELGPSVWHLHRQDWGLQSDIAGTQSAGLGCEKFGGHRGGNRCLCLGLCARLTPTRCVLSRKFWPLRNCQEQSAKWFENLILELFKITSWQLVNRFVPRLRRCSHNSATSQWSRVWMSTSIQLHCSCICRYIFFSALAALAQWLLRQVRLLWSGWWWIWPRCRPWNRSKCSTACSVPISTCSELY